MLTEIFADKALKAKARVAKIGDLLLNAELTLDELLIFSDAQSASDKATCIEAIEYATKKQPDIATLNVLAFVTQALTQEEPRIKWESARVIGNIAKLFPAHLHEPIDKLLQNAAGTGTVVRWACAFALAEIVKLKTDLNEKLLPAVEQLCEHEDDNGVKKKYLDALKKVKKK